MRSAARAPAARVAALALAAALALPAGLSRAEPASLIADAVDYDRDSKVLTASGNVEVYYQGRVLHAESITYDEAADEIRATGPLSITDAGGTVFLADTAELSSDLRQGLIEGGRVLIAGQLQIAASEIYRTGDRYTTLHQTIASSCTICAENPVPTWDIRAARVIEDQAAKRIYFEHARFEIIGVPVAYIPRMSIPDPSVRRASGFLLPEYRQSDIYGSGIRQPYYHVFSPSADATIIPFVSTGGAALLEGQYRRRIRSGGYDLWGVYAFDDGMGDHGRSAFAADGEFRLQRGFVAAFDVSHASDDSFLQEFDYSDADRLTSTARIYRVRAEDFIQLDTVAFQSLRADEETDTVPFVFPEFLYSRRGALPGVGGLFGVEASVLGITRQDGQDMLRVGGGGNWQQTWIAPNGLVTTALLRGDLDVYASSENPDQHDGTDFRIVPIAASEFRWPLQRATEHARHVLEPIVQVVYSEALGKVDVPNEDSQLPELDETNLFALNRYPGRDRVETGLRANVGIQYTRYDPDGWTLGMTLGRVIRAEDDQQFPTGTGLDGYLSDYVGAVAATFDTGLTVTNRALFDDELTFQRNEFALGFEDERAEVAASYTYFAEDDSNPILGPQPETDEFGIEASYRVRPNWSVRGLWRYDLASDSILKAEGGVTYGNECAEFELSVSRRYTSSSNLRPSTSISFGIQLAGLGGDGETNWPSRTCRLRGI